MLDDDRANESTSDATVDHNHPEQSVVRLADGHLIIYKKQAGIFTREHVSMNAKYEITERKSHLTPDGLFGKIEFYDDGEPSAPLITEFDPSTNAEKCYFLDDVLSAADTQVIIPVRIYHYGDDLKLEQVTYYDLRGVLEQRTEYTDLIAGQAHLFDAFARTASLMDQSHIYHFRNADHDEALWRTTGEELLRRVPILARVADESQIVEKIQTTDGIVGFHFDGEGRLLYHVHEKVDDDQTLWANVYVAPVWSRETKGACFTFNLTRRELVDMRDSHVPPAINKVTAQALATYRANARLSARENLPPPADVPPFVLS